VRRHRCLWLGVRIAKVGMIALRYGQRDTKLLCSPVIGWLTIQRRGSILTASKYVRRYIWSSQHTFEQMPASAYDWALLIAPSVKNKQGE
jgi:hypothetical protein